MGVSPSLLTSPSFLLYGERATPPNHPRLKARFVLREISSSELEIFFPFLLSGPSWLEYMVGSFSYQITCYLLG